MHLKKYLSLFLISFAFVIEGCSSGSSSGGLDRDPIEDIDGDGIADIVDPDMDGDGIPNEQDPDDDNDGVEDSVDPTPPVKPGTKTCVAATILPPNDETFPGKNGELSWELLPPGCVLPATRANAGTGVTVRAAPQRTGTATSATANAGNCAAKPNGNVQCFTEIKVPEGCGQFGVVYDISEVGDVLGDTDLSKGAYKQTVWHKGNSCETEPEAEEIYTIGDGTIKTGHTCVKEGSGVKCTGDIDQCSSGYTAYVVSAANEGQLIQNLTKPSWSGDGLGENFMNIYLEKKGDCETLIIYSNTDWATIQEDYGSCKVRTSLDLTSGACNFTSATQVLKVKGAEPLFTGFSSTTYSPSGGGSEPSFKVGNGEIETRDSTKCDMSSGAHDCVATQTLRGVEEYFLVSYGVDGATQLKYFNQPSWSFNPGPGGSVSQKMAVLISENSENCPTLGFNAQINQISGWPGRWGIGYNQGNYSWADILRSETANGFARGDMYVCKAIYSTVSGANFFVQHRGKELTMSAYSISRSGSPVVEINYPDLDNDGIPNDSDPDVDGDGIPNTSDKDIDGDGIPNKNDPDIDGDGQPNGVDPDADGDGTPDAQDDTPGGPQ